MSKATAERIRHSQEPVGKEVLYLELSEADYWGYEIKDYERAFENVGLRGVRNQAFGGIRFIAKVLAHSGGLRNIMKLPTKTFICSLMGLSERRLFPTCYVYESILICYDCWPTQYSRWEKLFRRHRVPLSFFSARQNVDYFSRTLPAMESLWLPEAVDPGEYLASRPLRDRSIDVLELGRHYDDFHRRIADILRNNNRSHLYAASPGRLQFPTRESLVRALADTRVSVCFPASVTHPERAGTVETVTYRYFESIASGCVVLGQCPNELRDLFGFNPCVEVDLPHADEQLLYVLANISSYQGFVDQNLERLIEVGTHEVRAQSLLRTLSDRGYKVPEPGR